MACGSLRSTRAREKIESFRERLIGRFAVGDVVNPITGKVIVPEGKMIDLYDANEIEAAGITKLKIRSLLTCRAKTGVCARCYGSDMANGEPVRLGESVGVIAAESIGEPGTQLTMRTFHTGGIASAEDITQGLPRVEELFESRRPKSMAIMSEDLRCRFSGRYQEECRHQGHWQGRERCRGRQELLHPVHPAFPRDAR